jgi:hypothetical protein
MADEIDWSQVRAMPLAEKLAFVMGQIDYVQKKGWNDFFKYNYVTEGDLVSAVRPLLSKAGVIIIPSVVQEERLENVIQERGGMASLTKITVEYTITDGKDTYTFLVPGHGSDRGDKGVYKAMTGAQKYALMKLFMVETGDDPERQTASETPAEVTITPSNEEGIGKGGRAAKATRYQLQRVSATVREKGIDRATFLSIINQMFDVELVIEDADEQGAQKTIVAFLKDLDSEEIGELMKVLDEYEVPADASA